MPVRFIFSVKAGGVLSIATFPLLWAALQEPILAQKISSGYVEDYPLSTLKSYAFAIQEREKQDGLADKPTNEALIKEVLGEEMEAAGFTRVASNPDFLVAFYTHRQLKTSYQALGRAAPRDFGTDHYEVGHLYVDFVVFQSKKAAWSGIASKALRNSQPEKLVRKACRKLVDQFRKDVRKQDKQRNRRE